MAYKLVLLGDGRVGKTSLVSRFTEDRFSPTEQSTVKAQMFKKTRVMIEGRPVELSIWDTAGQERFHALGPLYYRNADGAVLVYDITDTDSFDRVRQWIKELKKTVGDDITMVLCGNKCDLEKDKTVTEDQALSLARKHDANHFYTSAKLDRNVQEAFLDVITRAVRRRTGGGDGGFGNNSSLGGGGDLYGGGEVPSSGTGKKRRGVMVDPTTEDTGPKPIVFAPLEPTNATTTDDAAVAAAPAASSPSSRGATDASAGGSASAQNNSAPPARASPTSSAPPAVTPAKPPPKKQKKPCCK